MIKISQRSYELPLPEKITILGSRVTTSAQPHFLFDNNQLILTDNWVLQLVHTPITQKSKEPQLLEIPLTWEEVWPWDQEFPANATITYKKKPHIQLINSLSTIHSSPTLNLTLETPLELVFRTQEDRSVPINPTPTVQLPAQTDPAIPQQNYHSLEEKYLTLSQTVANLEERLLTIEGKLVERQPQAAKFSGYVVDTFRLAPVSKAILEFYQNTNEEPIYKLATSNQGYFAMEELPSGIYDIKIKHPRYQTLAIKSYVIANGENKSQDFLLKRI